METEKLKLYLLERRLSLAFMKKKINYKREKCDMEINDKVLINSKDCIVVNLAS